MNIGLIDPTEICQETENTIPLSLIQLASVAENIGHKVNLIRAQHTRGIRALKTIEVILKEYIFTHHPKILGFSNRTESLPVVVELARKCKIWDHKVLVILGGPGSSFVAKDILESFSSIDLVVCGEGEQTFQEIILAIDTNKDFDDIPGLVFNKNKKHIINTEFRSPISNLDELPHPAYHLIEDELFMRGKFGRTVHIEVGRGCPNNCSFCSTKIFWGSTVRLYSPERVVNQIGLLQSKYGINYFSLIHDNILSNHSFIRQFCKLIAERRLMIGWYAMGSINFSSKEIIKMISRAGCVKLLFGIETGSDRLGIDILRKRCDSAKFRKTMDITRKSGIKNIVRSYIFGFPNENKHDINDTLELEILEQARASVGSEEITQFHPLVIFPGTILYKKLSEELRYTVACGSFASKFVNSNENFIKLLKKYPKIFTAYSTHQSAEERFRTIEVCNLSWLMTQVFPRTTLLLMRRHRLDATEIMAKFRAFLQNFVWSNCSSESNSFYKSYNPIVKCIELYPQFISNVSDMSVAEEIETFLSYEKFRVILNSEKLINSKKNKPVHQKKIITPEQTHVISLDYDPDSTFVQWLKNMDVSVNPYGTETSFCFFLPRKLWGYQELPPNSSVWRLNEKNAKLVQSIVELAKSEKTEQDLTCETMEIMGSNNNKAKAEKAVKSYIELMLNAGVIVFADEINSGSYNELTSLSQVHNPC